MTTEEAIARTLARQEAAAQCGCGGSVHPEHELDDLAIGAMQARLGSTWWLGD